MTSANDLRLDIERRILSGELTAGTRLPSVRDLASQAGVAPATAAAAYRQLAGTGLVTTGRGRRGTRVAPRTAPIEPAPTIDVPEGMVDAAHGGPDPELLPAVDRAMAQALAATPARYGARLVRPELGAAAKALVEADGVDPSHLTVTSGAMDAIERALRAHGLRPGDRVGVEDPGHVPVHQLIRSAGLAPVALAVDEYGIRPEALAAASAEPLTAVVITPRAHNPTGAAHSADRAAALSEALGPEVLIIQDDHAGPVAGTDLHLLETGSRWIVIRSMGKSLGPDLRVAVVAGDVDTVGRMSLALANGPGWVSHLLQLTVTTLLNDPATARLVDRAARTYRHRRQRLLDQLERRGVHAIGRSGFNVWVPAVDEQAMVDAARRGGFVVRAGDPWRIRSSSAVRISTGTLTDDQIDQLATIIAPLPGAADSGLVHHGPLT